jgi:uncharacterized spore protein YtfJ
MRLLMSEYPLTLLVQRDAGDGPMTNVVNRAMEQAIGGMDVKQVFGEPIERDGVIYLPAAKVRGGGGGGGDTEGNGGTGSQPRYPRRADRGDRGAAGPALDLPPAQLSLRSAAD